MFDTIKVTLTMLGWEYDEVTYWNKNLEFHVGMPDTLDWEYKIVYDFDKNQYTLMEQMDFDYKNLLQTGSIEIIEKYVFDLVGKGDA